MKTGLVSKGRYKEIDISDVPEEWEVISLGDLVENSYGGGTPSTKNASYWDGDIPWTTTAVISEEDISLKTYQRCITEEGLSKSSSKIAPKGSVLIGTRVGVGKAVVTTFDIAINQDLTAIIPKPIVDPDFLVLALKTNYVQSLFRDRKRGATIQGIPRGDLLELTIYLPPLPEQKAIAHILSTVQRAKEATDQVIQATKELKKSLMKLLFTYGPVSPEEAQNVKLKETEIGMVPEGWRIKSVEELMDFSRKSRSLKVEELEEIPFIPMEMISEDGIKVLGWELRKITDITSGTFVNKNDLIVAKITPCFENGKQAILDNLPKDFGYATTEVWAIHPKNDETIVEHVSNYLKLPLIRHDLASKMEGATGRQRLPRHVLANLRIPLPPLPEQQIIVEALTSLDTKIEQEENQLHTLDQLFKTLLNNLMTGKMRVKNFTE